MYLAFVPRFVAGTAPFVGGAALHTFLAHYSTPYLCLRAVQCIIGYVLILLAFWAYHVILCGFLYASLYGSNVLSAYSKVGEHLMFVVPYIPSISSVLAPFDLNTYTEPTGLFVGKFVHDLHNFSIKYDSLIMGKM